MLTFLEPGDSPLRKQVCMRLKRFSDVKLSDSDLTTCLEKAKSLALVFLSQEGMMKFLIPVLRWQEGAEGMLYILSGQQVLRAGPSVLTLSSISSPPKFFTKLIFAASGLGSEMKEILQFLIKRHGGLYKSKLKRTVTNLLVKEPGSAKYKAACESGMTILCPSWVFDAVLYGSLPDQKDQKYAVPIFPRNAKISTTEFTPEGRRQLKRLIIEYGGEYESGMCRATKFLIARGWSKKTEFALKHSVPVLSREWIFDMVRFRGCIDIRDYEIQFEERKFVYPPLVKKGHQLDFMCGVVVAMVGLSEAEKVRAFDILKVSGARGVEGTVDEATHILCNVRERHLEGLENVGDRPIVSLSWVERCYRSKTIVDVTAHEDAVKLPSKIKVKQIPNDSNLKVRERHEDQNPRHSSRNIGQRREEKEVQQQSIPVLCDSREERKTASPLNALSQDRGNVPSVTRSPASKVNRVCPKDNAEESGTRRSKENMRVSSGVSAPSVMPKQKRFERKYKSVTKRRSQEIRIVDSRRKRQKPLDCRIMFSGWEQWEGVRKKRLLQEITKFENVREEADLKKVTHVVSGALMKNVKTIVAFMNGAKITMPSWVEACIEKGNTVSEGPYL